MRLLRARGVIRSFNNPVADVAEWLVAKNLSLTLAPLSEKSYDAIDKQGKRYQIKARWLAGTNLSTELGAIRDLSPSSFDYLVGVVFDSEFHVDYAALIPVSVVIGRSKFVQRTNSYRFHFTRSTLTMSGVEDITDQLMVFPPSTDFERRLLAAGPSTIERPCDEV